MEPDIVDLTSAILDRQPNLRQIRVNVMAPCVLFRELRWDSYNPVQGVHNDPSLILSAYLRPLFLHSFELCTLCSMGMLSKLAEAYRACERFPDLVRLREMLGAYTFQTSLQSGFHRSCYSWRALCEPECQ